MNRSDGPTANSQPVGWTPGERFDGWRPDSGPQPEQLPSEPAREPPDPPDFKISKTLTLFSRGGKALHLEVFTLTLGEETIELLPFKNWSQLDHFKWTARGKLPAEPAGLEITPEQVRLAGETILLSDAAGCGKLQVLFNHWLLFERETQRLARHKSHPVHLCAAPEPSAQSRAGPLRFQVEVDKRGQVHIHCVRGREVLVSIGLTLAGFASLQHQGLMRKPHTLETGALHDWVELDGELFSFEKGRNDAARLERMLNEHFLPPASASSATQVLVLLNAASPTGFDLQFPVMVGGVLDNHPQHLTEHCLELLQDPTHCGLLHPDLIIRLIPPNLVFKRKTPDGSEQSLPWGPLTTVTTQDEDGHQKVMALSEPLNLMHLSVAELTAVFNHPAINRHSQALAPASNLGESADRLPPSTMGEVRPSVSPAQPGSTGELPGARFEPVAPDRGVMVPEPSSAQAAQAPVESMTTEPREFPNQWLKDILYQPSLEHEWFACLVYSKMAERFGNSTEGKFGPTPCWFISLGDCEDITVPSFKGIILTEKGGLGFLNDGHMARFYDGVAFLGRRKHALEGVSVSLVAVGLDTQQHMVFILSDNYRAQFGVPAATLNCVLEQLKESGAVIASCAEILASREPVEVVWTVPVDQSAPSEPQARESKKPWG